MKKLTAVLLCLAMLSSFLPALGESSPKWTEEVTADGWTKVTNENGATLGYSADSGVKIIEVDGYAFKDLNKNGELDVYEDWRVDDKTRAKDLAGKIDDPSFLLYLMLHPSLGTIETDGSTAVVNKVDIKEFIDKGLRSALNGSVGKFPAKSLAVFTNNVQAYSEAQDYGIPFNFSSNPNNLGFARSLMLASSFDTEYVNEVYQMEAKLYRAIGVTTLLGPQVDLTTEPRWNRIRDTFGEDPALSRDMAIAAFNGLQSTYSENGEDLGWGADSVATVMKHWPGDGSGESGRESHAASGKYTVYPGDGFDTLLIPFVDGALKLDGKTESATGVMMSYSIAYSETEEYGELVASPFSAYKMNLARSYSPDILICSDWSSVTSRAYGIDENATEAEKFAAAILNGLDQLGGVADGDFEGTLFLLEDELGEEGMLTRLQDSAYRILLPMFHVDLFENPYVDVAASVALYNDAEIKTAMEESKTANIVMIKNSEGVIKQANGETTEKPTVYVPMVWENGVGATPGQNTTPQWHLLVDLATLSQYFNVVTDTPAEPSGEDGKYTENDIIRATAEEIAACDMVICFTEGPKNAGSEGKGYGHDNDTDEYFPISLQYGEYVANSAAVRGESISGDLVVTVVNDLYEDIAVVEKANYSYFGKSARVVNSSDLEGILWGAENASEGVPVIVCVNSIRPLVFSEFEEKVGTILVGYSIDYANFLDVILGKVEPNGLLPLQYPASMEVVEAQQEDVPRDMECYVDAQGNTYDFAFGMNWSGIINDERVANYKVDPILTPENQPVK